MDHLGSSSSGGNPYSQGDARLRKGKRSQSFDDAETSSSTSPFEHGLDTSFARPGPSSAATPPSLSSVTTLPSISSAATPSATLLSASSAPHPPSSSRPILPSSSSFVCTFYIATGAAANYRNLAEGLLRKCGGKVQEMRGSIILQASLAIISFVLAEIGKFATEHLSREENRSCTIQLSNWAIFCYYGGKVCLHMLAEGEVPVIVEARVYKGGPGFIIRGLYLNGVQFRAADKRDYAILRSVDPPVQEPGQLDEVYIKETDIRFVSALEQLKPLVYASRVVKAEGFSLIVRSEALPLQGNSFLMVLRDGVQKISLSSMKVIKSLLKFEDHQPGTNQLEVAAARVENWKGALEVEMFDHINREVYGSPLQQHLWRIEWDRFYIGMLFQPHPRTIERDQAYWKRALHDLNEVIQQDTKYAVESYKKADSGRV